MDQETLKRILFYDPETGVFVWRIKANYRIYREGVIAGSISKKGYRKILYRSKSYSAHHLAWLYIYGELPKDQLDHINGLRDDNRIANLRQVSNRGNAINKLIHRNGKLPGAYYNRGSKKWDSYISINGFHKKIGSFTTENEANQEYMGEYMRLEALNV